MDEVIVIMHEFIDQEYKVVIAQYTEHDDRVFQARLAELKKFYSPDVKPEAKRAPGKNDEWFEKAKEGMKSVAHRVLFQVKQYDHPTLGGLYRCYTSNYLRAANKANYFTNFYIANTNDGLKIVAKYLICFTCNSTGLENGEPCPDCEFNGWDHSDGIELEELGRLVEVRKLRKPDKAEHLTEYESE